MGGGRIMRQRGRAGKQKGGVGRQGKKKGRRVGRHLGRDSREASWRFGRQGDGWQGCLRRRREDGMVELVGRVGESRH
jgi:hypothetical protein